MNITFLISSLAEQSPRNPAYDIYLDYIKDQDKKILLNN